MQVRLVRQTNRSLHPDWTTVCCDCLLCFLRRYLLLFFVTILHPDWTTVYFDCAFLYLLVFTVPTHAQYKVDVWEFGFHFMREKFSSLWYALHSTRTTYKVHSTTTTILLIQVYYTLFYSPTLYYLYP